MTNVGGGFEAPRWRVRGGALRFSRRSALNLFRRAAARAGSAEAALDIIEHQVLEIGRKRRAAQGVGLLAVDEHRGGRLLAGARQRDADVGVLGLARAVDD